MALLQCPECGHNVSDKAVACPGCGYPIRISQPPKPVTRTRKKHKKLPNGFGSIKKLSGNRRKPYAAYPPTKEYQLNGTPITLPAIGYYEDWYAAFDALREYNHNPFDVRTAGLTFSDVYEQWWKAKFENGHKQYADDTKKSYSWAYKQCSALYNMKMKDIYKQEMQSILDGCTLGYSSVSNLKKLFSQMFWYSLENGIVEKDYSQFLTINKEYDIESGEPFTEAELQLLWQHKDDPNVQIILIMIYSGLRIGEMKITEIDLAKRCFKGGLKTPAGKERVVPIHDAIYDFVRDFSQAKFHPGTFGDKKFYKTILSIGFAPLTNGKKHTPHDCRHTFSWLCDKYKVDDISKHLIMGHSLGKDVEKSVYGHRTYEQLVEEMRKISISRTDRICC